MRWWARTAKTDGGKMVSGGDSLWLEIIQYPGVWNLPVLGFSALALLGLLVGFILLFLRVRTPTAAWLAVALLPLISGAVAMSVGLSETLMVIGTAPPEMRDTLTAAGIGISSYPLILAVLAPLLVLMSGTLVQGVVSWLRAGETRPIHLVDGLLPAGLGLLASAILGLTAGWWEGVLLFGATMGLFLAATRREEDPDKRAAHAALRGRAAWLAALIPALAGLSQSLWSWAHIFRAVALAPPEMSQELIHVEHWGLPLLGGGLGSVLMIGAGIATVMAVRTDLWRPRAWIGAGAALVVTLVAAASVAAPLVQASTILLDQVAEHAARDELPVVPRDLDLRDERQRLTVRVQDGQVDVGGSELGPLDAMAMSHDMPAELWAIVHDRVQEQREIAAATGLAEARFHGEWNLDADASLPLDDLQRIVRTLASEGSGELHIIVATPDRRRATIGVRFDEERPPAGAKPPRASGTQLGPDEAAVVEDRFVDLVLEPGEEGSDVPESGKINAANEGPRLRVEASPDKSLQDLVDRLVASPHPVTLEFE